MNNKNKNIDIDATALYVIALLNEYEDNIEKGRKPNLDPYNEKIYMNVGNDTIEIPDDIKKKAIVKWNIMKEANIDYENIKHDDHIFFEILTIIICVIIIIFMLYGIGYMRHLYKLSIINNILTNIKDLFYVLSK